MERFKFLRVIVVLAITVPHLSSSSLSISKECGDFTCQAHDYCRPIDHICQPCSTACNTSNHNFDQSRCESDCQDYLHDVRYLRVQNGSEDLLLSNLYLELQHDVKVLQVLVYTSLGVIFITVVSFIAFVIYVWKIVYPTKGGKNLELPTIYDNKFGISQSSELSPPPSVKQGSTPMNGTSNQIITNTNSSGATSPVKSEASMNSINATQRTMSTLVNTGSTNGTVNQRFRREPSESTLPDSAYDNASLSPKHYSHHV